jgi:hypothetical protein
MNKNTIKSQEKGFVAEVIISLPTSLQSQDERF